jgi:glycosyltransferase involved in cell wall biosynthesis
MDPGVKNLKEKIVKGVKCRLFPAFNIKWKRINFSFILLRELRREYSKNEILIHVTNTHTFDIIAIACYLRKAPLLASHLGGAHPLFKLKQEKRFLSFFKYLLEKCSLRSVDEIFASVKAEQDYFAKILRKGRVCFGPNQGVEEDFLKSPVGDKKTARQKLGIPIEKKVLLTVGRLEKEMGCDETLKVFNRLKKEYDMVWLAVGTDKSNSYYREAKEAGVKVIGYIGRDKGLMDYFTAADVYAYPMYNDLLTLEFGGTGMATLEALFFNLPYVGNGIVHIPNGEGKKAGIIPKNSDELYQGIKTAFDQPHQFKETRDLVLKYYSWEKVIGRYINAYQRWFSHYYGD